MLVYVHVHILHVRRKFVYLSINVYQDVNVKSELLFV